MQPKTIKSKNNNMFIMEDDLNLFRKLKTTSKNIMQPKTIESKNNDCGTAPGNLVYLLLSKNHKCQG
jgi:hypothetical protein